MTSASITWSVRADAPSFPRLHDALAPFVPISVLDRRDGADRGEFASMVPIDDVVYVDVSWSSRELARRATSAMPAGDGYFALAAVRSGSEVVGIGGNTYRLTAGDVVLWDCQAPTLFSVPTRLRKSALLIPVSVLAHMSLIPRGGGGLEFFNDAPTAPLLRQLLTHLGDHPQPLSTAYRRTRNALLELALGTIESVRDTESTSLACALRISVSRWIDDHIFDPDLRPTTIAAAHAVSVRTLHRAFESEPQTVAEVVSMRKLERARDLLSEGRSVTAVSAVLNFANPSHFSRVFAAQFRITPSQYKHHTGTNGCEALTEASA